MARPAGRIPDVKCRILHIRVAEEWRQALEDWLGRHVTPPTMSDVVRDAVEEYVARHPRYERENVAQQIIAEQRDYRKGTE